MKPIAIVISCEHAVNTVPEAYQDLFAAYQHLLQSHRGIDFGALAIAQHLSKHFQCDLVQAKATRLLIDCNRSLSHPHCFSEVTSSLPIKQKEEIINHYYLPFRQQVETLIKSYLNQEMQVWHLSIHSFVPQLKNQIRNTDIGFLYDPKRVNEKKLAREWKQALNEQTTHLRTRMNYPYLGISDGFTSSLRKNISTTDYLGLEIENNQALVFDSTTLTSLSQALTLSLAKISLALRQ